MSAWPEAVWIVKKMNQVFDITHIIEQNNSKVNAVLAKLTTVENTQTRIDSAANLAGQQIITANETVEDLQDQIDELSAEIAQLEEKLERIDQSAIANVRAEIQQVRTTIDKELIVITTNNESSQNPRPKDIGDNVSKHSVFLIITE